MIDGNLKVYSYVSFFSFYSFPLFIILLLILYNLINTDTIQVNKDDKMTAGT